MMDNNIEYARQYGGWHFRLKEVLTDMENCGMPITPEYPPQAVNRMRWQLQEVVWWMEKMGAAFEGDGLSDDAGG